MRRSASLQLAATAESNDAPNNRVEKLRSLGVEEFSGPDKVMAPTNIRKEAPEDLYIRALSSERSAEALSKTSALLLLLNFSRPQTSRCSRSRRLQTAWHE
jgi:hypothetical protein